MKCRIENVILNFVAIKDEKLNASIKRAEELESQLRGG